MNGTRYFIIGGAGFIGSHFTDHLLGLADTVGVTLFDNFSSGREWHYSHHLSDARLRVIVGDAKEMGALIEAMHGHDVVIHLASNPDIAKAATEPDIDFREGTVLTQNVLEAMRITVTPWMLYASGSGVYGDMGELEAEEDHGPLLPISTYGASKLAGEALIASYTYMFGLRSCAFRFGNVVGPRQTHGVGFDFVRSLLKDSSRLPILGDGSQSKSYVHVDDVVSAVLRTRDLVTEPYSVFNVATGDYITVAEIAAVAMEVLGLAPENVRLEYAGGNRGWKGDVPIVRLNTDRIRELGWSCRFGSREALRQSMAAIVRDFREHPRAIE